MTSWVLVENVWGTLGLVAFKIDFQHVASSILMIVFQPIFLIDVTCESPHKYSWNLEI